MNRETKESRGKTELKVKTAHLAHLEETANQVLQVNRENKATTELKVKWENKATTEPKVKWEFKVLKASVAVTIQKSLLKFWTKLIVAVRQVDLVLLDHRFKTAPIVIVLKVPLQSVT